MKILIISGGTGSIAIQKGLADVFREIEDVDIKVLVNAYDNGKSTGAVRKVADGKILGPSDLRKNQTVLFENVKRTYKDQDVVRFMDERVTLTSDKVKEYVNELISVTFKQPSQKEILWNAVQTYFNSPTALMIDYTDFSISNIVYAGLAMSNGNSLRKAGTIMAKILDIPDNVILNDDTSLFLSAMTKSGFEIYDEADIVSWNNKEDPIQSLNFKNSKGQIEWPWLCDEAKNAIKEADFIILSSGTMWSSLFPTYESTGFAECLGTAKGKIIMVMNMVADYDAPSMSADDIINHMDQNYISADKIRLIENELSAMRVSEEVFKMLKGVTTIKDIANRQHYYSTFPKVELTRVHEPTEIADAIIKTMFAEYSGISYVFDYDDTLVARGNQKPHVSNANLRLINRLSKETANITICTGNSIGNISAYISPTVNVYADGGINYYSKDESGNYKMQSSAADGFIIDQQDINRIIDAILSLKISKTRIENRGNTVIAIRPIPDEFRHSVMMALENFEFSNHFSIVATGRSTVEISKLGLSKAFAVEKIVNDIWPTVYVGDEFDKGGNDECTLSIPGVKCLSVKSPSMTFAFLTSLGIKHIEIRKA